MAPGGLLQQVPVSGGMELRDPRQRDARYHPCTGGVEALLGRSPTPGRDLVTKK